jgi:hypothetical protein
MKQSAFVRPLDIAVRATVVFMLIWAACIVPGGAPWTAVAWFGALAVLVVGTATLGIGLALIPSAARADRRRGARG